MAKTYGSLVSTPVIKLLQELWGSTWPDARLEQAADAPARRGPDELDFVSDERDTFNMASVGATGWPYLQHRGGPNGFPKGIDDRTIAFPDFSGNKRNVGTGNPITDDRVLLIRRFFAWREEFPSAFALRWFCSKSRRDGIR